MIPRAVGLTRRRALSSISASATAAAAAVAGARAAVPGVQRQRRDRQHQAAAQPTLLAFSAAPPPLVDVAAPPSWARMGLGTPPPTTLQRPRTSPLAAASPLSATALLSPRRGLVTQAAQRPRASATAAGQSPLVQTSNKRPSGRLPQHLQTRGFWTPRFMRQIGVPWIVQIFYGTLLMVGIGILAVSLFATSFVFGFLFLLVFAGFRLFSQRPQLARQVLRGPAQSPAGAFLRPLMEMLNEGVLMDGLKNARGTIERDVLACLNRHPRLKAYGQDFKSTGLTNMSLESVNINGQQRQHVVMEMLVVSSKPREVFVRVAASHHEGQLEGDADDRWEYERVEARTPDGYVVDLTQEVTRGGKGKNIVIDVPPRNVREGGGGGQ